MLSVSSQSSNSDPQLEGHTSFLTVPPSPRPSISLPAQSCCPPSPGNVHPHSFSLYQVFLQPAPQCLTGTPPLPLLSWGTPQTVPPSLCPDLWAVPPSVGGFGRIPPPQHLGISRSLGHSGLGRPFPMRQAGKGRTPLLLPVLFGQDCPEGSGLAPCPPVHLLPAPLRLCSPSPVPGTQGSAGWLWGAECPPPLPRSRGLQDTHAANDSSLWFGADGPGGSGQPAGAGSLSCSQRAHAERKNPLCTESGTPRAPHVSPCAVRSLSGTGRGGRAGESSSRTFCGS